MKREPTKPLSSVNRFGVWEIRMPTSLMNRAGARAGGAGAFGMGLFVGVVAAPCIGGFIVGLLAFVAARQDPFLGFLFFFTLSLGLGLPYLFLAAYSGRLSRLPRAGEWMDGVKKVFGWVLLAMAAYFLRSVVPAPAGRWLLPAVLVIGAVAILVSGLNLAWPVRAGAAAILLAIAFFFVPHELKGWQPYAPEAVGAAREAGLWITGRVANFPGASPGTTRNVLERLAAAGAASVIALRMAELCFVKVSRPYIFGAARRVPDPRRCAPRAA